MPKSPNETDPDTLPPADFRSNWPAQPDIRIWICPKLPEYPHQLRAALVYAPDVHAFWSWHRVSLVSLAEDPEHPADLLFPEAAYELLVLALDPHQPIIGPHDPRPYYLMPPDYMVQLGAGDVEGLWEAIVQGVLTGHLPPDSDYHSHWTRFIGEHYAGQVVA